MPFRFFKKQLKHLKLGGLVPCQSGTTLMHHNEEYQFN